MKQKQLRIAAVLLVMCLICVSLLSACAGSGSQPGPTDTTAGTDNGTETDAPSGETDLTLFTSGDAYRIVYPQAPTEALKAMVTELSNAAKAVTGKKPTACSDNTAKNPETGKEILIGPTGRAESLAVAERLPAVGYRIEQVGEKLVLQATDDTMLGKAVRLLMEEWKTEDGKVTVEGVTRTHDGSGEMLPLTDGTDFLYTLIVPATADDALTTAVGSFAGRLGALLGKKISWQYDVQVPEKEDAREIVIGNSTRTESQKFFKELGYFEYRIEGRGNSLYVGSCLNRYDDALNLLYDELKAAFDGAYRGEAKIPKDWRRVEYLYAFSDRVPMMDGGSFEGIYDAGNDCFVVSLKDTTATAYEAYLKKLTDGGLTGTAAYTMGDNRFALFEGDAANVYVSYFAATASVRIFAEKAGANNAAPQDIAGEKRYTPRLWQLTVDNYNTKANGGMSYVIRTEDGSFIVIDGGYETNTEADNLYKLLAANTPDGEKPVISAWFITHLHYDHFGGFLRFTDRYRDKVELRGMYYNFPERSVTTGLRLDAVATIRSAAKKWSGCVLYEKLHTGMTFTVCGIEISVMCTHENVYPYTFADANDTCTVLRVTAAGQRILFLADARDQESAAMLRNFSADDLKCDIVQFAHHGYEGCSVALYRAVGASTVLWPMHLVGWQETGYKDIPQKVFAFWLKRLPANAWVVESDTVKKIIVAAETTEISLPYVPIGDKLPDYDRLADEIISGSV